MEDVQGQTEGEQNANQGQNSINVSPPADNQQPAVVQPGIKKPRKKLWFIVLLLIIIGLATGGAYWYMNKDNKAAKTTENTKKDIALLRYGAFEGILNQFHPTTEDDVVTLLINRQIFESLVQFEDETKIVPQLATGWTNPDDTTWVFTLKPGVKFHTGNTMTAKDVVYSYNEIKKNELVGPIATSTIKSVEAEGDDKVKITTNGVDPIFLNRLANLPIIDSAAEGKSDPKYGSGPYTVKEGTIPTETNIDLVAFDNYHGGHIYTRELQVSVYSTADGDTDAAETNALTDLKADKVDIIGFLTGARLADAKSGGLNIFPVDPPSVYKLMLNTKKAGSPLANLKFRQALTYAIDIDALLKAVGRDQTGKSASQLISQPIPGYNPSITRPKRDIEKAKQLVKDAGYGSGATFTLTVGAQSTDVANELARQLKEANITLKVNALEDTTNFFSDIDDGKTEAAYYSEGSDVLDGSDVFASILGTPNYVNQSASDLLDKAGNTLDQTTRLGYLKQISQLLSDDVAQVPLYTNNSTWVSGKPYVMATDILGMDLGVNFYKVYLK